MCSRQARIALDKWTRVKAPRGDLRMNLLIWCMLVLFVCSSSKEMVLDKNRPARLHAYEIEKGRHFIQNLKRHSDGTFTSDFTTYRDKIKAKDFVEWLASIKRNGCAEDLLQVEMV